MDLVRSDPTQLRLLVTHYATILLLFASAVGFVFVSIEGYFGVIEKAQEFGVLRVLGASTRYFLLLMFLETLTVSVPGIVVATGLTFLTRWGLGLFLADFLRLDVVYLSWPITFGITVAASLIGGVVGTGKAIGDGVAQALSYEV